MLRESARGFASRERDLSAFRARMGQVPGYDAVHFQQMRDLGWAGTLVREELGGAGMGLREAAAIAEELGRSLLGDLFLATCVLPVALLEDRAALPSASPVLRAIALGNTVAALAWQERPDSLDPACIETRAKRCSEGYLLTGGKQWVAGAPATSTLLVSARLDGGIAVFGVPRDLAGVSLRLQWQADGTAASLLRLDEAQVTADALIIGPDDGVGAIRRALDQAAVAASAELLGVACSAFDLTLSYMKTRVQFGQPIGSFQALQHKAVDLLVQRELASSVLDEAVAALSGGSVDENARSSVAGRCKARCSDAALRITRECIQLHGAIGYTHEYDLGLYVKRALVLAAWLGNGAQHRARQHQAVLGADKARQGRLTVSAVPGSPCPEA